MIRRADVLDKGYVMLLRTMGEDLEPVNDARVSYDKQTKEWSDRDAGLLNYLGREDHTSPFRGSILKFEVYAPLMIARQWFKYVIGSDHDEQPERNVDTFMQWNESSRRYITEEPEFYMVPPAKWREAPENSKQGSGDNLPVGLGKELSLRLNMYQQEGLQLYEHAMRQGVAPEQARLFLPAYGMYVRFRWTASLQGVCHLLNQRLAKDSQKEFQLYARAVKELAMTQFPKAVSAMVDQKIQQQELMDMIDKLRKTTGLSLEDIHSAFLLAQVSNPDE